MTEVDILTTWTLEWLKHKDMMVKHIVSIEQKPGVLLVKKTTGEQKILVLSHNELKEKMDEIKTGIVCIVMLNTRDTVEEVFQYWTELVKNPALSVIFAHPTKNEKWALYPTTHDSITEKSVLKKGLFSLFESVSEWTD